jgi:exopolysaccharide production protein ExoZ
MHGILISVSGLGDTRSHDLRSIQALRAIAALAVVFHHVPYETAVRIGWVGALPESTVGAAGVDLFFVISGFVMVYASDTLFGRRDAARTFILRRIARIVPLYWAISALLLVEMLLKNHGLPPGFISIEGVLASFVFVPYPRPTGEIGPIHALGWTLNYEMFFYVCFAVALLSSRRRAVLALASAFAAFVTTGRLFFLPQPLSFWFDPIILEFCYGMLIALAYREGVRLTLRLSLNVVIAAVLAFGASFVFGVVIEWRAVQWGLPCAAVVAGLVLSSASWKPGLPGQAFAFLGDASYSLYLMHMILFAMVRPISHWVDPALFVWPYAVLLVVVAIAGSGAMYRLFERPVTRALQARIRAIGTRSATLNNSSRGTLRHPGD